MSVDVLRQAAALMRERAEAADPEARWLSMGQLTGEFNRPTAEHIASWGPAVALAVVIGMECAAEALEIRGVTAHIKPAERAWIDLAATYLGADA